MLSCNSRITQHSLSVASQILYTQIHKPNGATISSVTLSWSSLCLSCISPIFCYFHTASNQTNGPEYFLFCRDQKCILKRGLSVVRVCAHCTEISHRAGTLYYSAVNGFKMFIIIASCHWLLKSLPLASAVKLSHN